MARRKKPRTLSEQLRDQIGSAKISAYELAEASGVNRSVLSRLPRRQAHHHPRDRRPTRRGAQAPIDRPVSGPASDRVQRDRSRPDRRGIRRSRLRPTVRSSRRPGGRNGAEVGP